MGFFAARAATRMGARQQYRTMARMQRRRSYFQSSTGMHQDFEHRDEDPEYQNNQSSEDEDYTSELQKLSKLENQGLITHEEYQAKKKQILGL